MIVTDDDVGAITHDGRAENFGDAQHRAIDCAFVAFDVLDHLIFGIKYQDVHFVNVSLKSAISTTGRSHQKAALFFSVVLAKWLSCCNNVYPSSVSGSTPNALEHCIQSA